MDALFFVFSKTGVAGSVLFVLLCEAVGLGGQDMYCRGQGHCSIYIIITASSIFPWGNSMGGLCGKI